MGIIPKNPNETLYVGGKKHFRDIIKNRGNADAIVFREPEEDFNNNSTLVVMPGEKAIFIHNGRIEGIVENGTHILSTENIPFLTRMRTMLSGGISEYNCVIIFVRTTSTKEIVWGDRIALADPALKIMTEFGVNGAYRVCITDPERLIMSILGANALGMTGDMLQKYCSHQFLTIIKSYLVRTILESKDDLRNITANLKTYSDNLFPLLGEVFNQYGLKLLSFSISDMELHQDEVRQRVEGTLGTKAEMEILGDNWEKVRASEALTNFSKNPGPSGTMGGLGTALAMAPFITRMMGQFVPANDNKSSTSPEDIPVYSGESDACDRCHYAMSAGMKFCPQCGKERVGMKTCPFCNAKNDSSACFCSTCGKKLAKK